MSENLPNDSMQVVTARWIVPVIGEPIQGGWLRLQGDRIIEIQSGKAPASAIDLGDVALLPGLVNAHTHLEFSDCAEPIGDPGVPLATWIGQVIAARSQTTAATKQSAIESGIQQSRASGVRLIGEIASPPISYDAHDADIVSFAEVVGLSEARWRERFESALDHNQRNQSGAWSPHAPYSTTNEAIDACVKQAVSSQRPIAMHVAESPAERELLCGGTGPFADSLRAIGVWREGLFPWDQDPIVGLIERLAAAPHTLLIHCNDFRKSEIEAVSQQAKFTIVYCPRTHAFFGYDRHPVAEMVRAGIPVALGTDSKASNPDLNLWSEVQFLLMHRMDLNPRDVLKMATVHGANALSRPKMGRIQIDAEPRLGVVATSADSVEALYRDFATNPYQPFSPET